MTRSASYSTDPLLQKMIAENDTPWLNFINSVIRRGGDVIWIDHSDRNTQVLLIWKKKQYDISDITSAIVMKGLKV